DVEPREREHDRGDEGSKRRDNEGDEHLQQPAAPAIASAHPKDDEADDKDEARARAGGGPERGTREKHDRRSADDREADQRPRPLLSLREHLLGQGAFLALAGHDKRRGKIDENSCPSEQGENDEADAKSRRVELEVAAKSAADAREHLVRRAPLEPPYRIGISDVVCHAPSLPRPRTQDHPDFPWSHPDPQERGITPARLANCGGRWSPTQRRLSKT